jgi:hypothetical protein
MLALNLEAPLNEHTKANLTPGGNSRARFTFDRFNRPLGECRSRESGRKRS